MSHEAPHLPTCHGFVRPGVPTRPSNLVQPVQPRHHRLDDGSWLSVLKGFMEEKKERKLLPASRAVGKSTDLGDKILKYWKDSWPPHIQWPPPIQSSAMDIAKVKDLRVAIDKAQQSFKDMGAKLVTMVHDEYICEMKVENIEEVGKRVRQRMIENGRLLDVPLKIQPDVSPSWEDLEKMPMVSIDTETDPIARASKLLSDMQKQLDAANDKNEHLENKVAMLEGEARLYKDQRDYKQQVINEQERTISSLRDDVGDALVASERYAKMHIEAETELINLQHSYNVLSDANKAMNDMFMFLARLDLQDHPIADQKKFMELFRALKPRLEEANKTCRSKK